MSREAPLEVLYFSDVLCIWAYAAEARLNEVALQFGDQVTVKRRYCSIFGDTVTRIGGGWRDRGGYEGFNAHMQEVAAQFDHIEVHPRLWIDAKPPSSSGIHLFLKALQLVGGDAGPSDAAAWALRLAFFRYGRDIARAEVQIEIAQDLGVSSDAVGEEIASGRAFAALSADLDAGDKMGVEGSPTFVLNEGRQKLYGNIGYRVIEANLRELLETSGRDRASWC
jgi:predicted DsbA family dithiol-disulfide isomerase